MTPEDKSVVFAKENLPDRFNLIVNDWENRKQGGPDKQGIPSHPLDCRGIHFYTWTTYYLLQEAQKRGVVLDPDTSARAKKLMDESKTIAWPGSEDPILSDNYASYYQAESHDKQ